MCQTQIEVNEVSLLQDFSAEVVILAKFLRAAERGALTTDPDEADVFLVPWLTAGARICVSDLVGVRQ